MPATPWCLFLDRDGVINQRKAGGYVRSWAEFEFLPGSLSALAILSSRAPRVVVVTNQQGIGKGLVSRAEVERIHHRMIEYAARAGAKIDAVLVCPHLELEACECRKPNPGLAYRWLRAHPEVDGAHSVMVGDSTSDILMARALAQSTGGCQAIAIGDSVPNGIADARFGSLIEFATAMSTLDEEQDL